MDQMREQALRFGADLRMEDVESVSLDGPVKSVTTAEGETVHARAVILAMGAAARYLHVPGEQELLGRGVSSCATCDGFFFRDQDIAVIGGGDSAMEEATFLTKFARSVTLVHRRDEFRASRIMLERAQANDKIRFVTNTVVDAVEGDTTVTGLRVRDTVTGEESTLPVTGVFVAIGHDPRSELVRGAVDLDPEGYVRGPRQHHLHLARRRVCRRRPGRPHLPAGRHRRGHRLLGGHRRRALAGRPRRAGRRTQTNPPKLRRQRHFDWSTCDDTAPSPPAHPWMSPTPRSTATCCPAIRLCWLTFGPPGADRARWSPRCWRRSPPSTAGAADRRETRRRRKPRDRAQLPGGVDPDADLVQGRRAGQADRRRQGQGGAAARAFRRRSRPRLVR